MNGDLIALPIALIVLAYHYGITRDVRRTLHRMADALEDQLDGWSGDDEDPPAPSPSPRR